MITTQEGNTVIAIYDGWIKTTVHRKYGQLYRQPNRMGEFWPQKWEYHYNWNWLIPVAKKCINAFHDHRGDIFDALHKCDIEMLWSAIVVYILWLEKNKEEVDCFQKHRKVYWNDETKKCEAEKYKNT